MGQRDNPISMRHAPRVTVRSAGAVAVALAVLVATPLAQAVSQDEAPPPIVVNALRTRVLMSGLEPPAAATLYTTDADSLLASLQDPYATLLAPPAYEEFRASSGTRYGGIGARIVARADTVWVTTVFPGSPAEASGLRPLDRVVGIDGQDAVGWSTGMAVGELRGPVGSTLTLTVVRGRHREPMSVTVRRGHVRVPSVQAALVDSTGVGIVRLAKFGEGAAQDLRLALDSLGEAGMTGLILDLRANPGGLLSEALEVARLFLHPDQLITEVRGRRNTKPIRFLDRTPDAYHGLPIVVVTGPSTASAAEIVAGALQDHERAIVLGTRSYGKGSVQQIFQLPRHWRVKLTTARWYRPSGQPLERLSPNEHNSGTDRAGGIVPDLILSDSLRLMAERVVESFGGRWPSVASAILQEVSVFLDSAEVVRRNVNIPGPTVAQMLDRRSGGLLLPPSTDQEEAYRWLGQRLSHLIVSARWGQAAGTEWRYGHDTQILAATDLLRQVRSPAALVALVRWSRARQLAEQLLAPERRASLVH